MAHVNQMEYAAALEVTMVSIAVKVHVTPYHISRHMTDSWQHQHVRMGARDTVRAQGVGVSVQRAMAVRTVPQSMSSRRVLLVGSISCPTVSGKHTCPETVIAHHIMQTIRTVLPYVSLHDLLPNYSLLHSKFL
jgi:hypothetical protein